MASMKICVPVALIAAMAMGAAAASAAEAETVDAAERTDFGLALAAGRTAVESFNRTDVDKSGNAFAASLFLRRPLWLGAWQIGVGQMATSLEGSDRRRGFENQKLDVSSTFGEVRYLFDLPAGFELGLGVRGSFGKGADYDVRHVDQASYDFAGGPVFGYGIRLGDWRLAAEASYALNLNENDRRVQTLLAGVALSYGFGGAAPRPAAQAEPPKPTAAVVQLPVNLDEPVSHFAFGKSTLSPALRRRILALGRTLAREQERLTGVTVAGHTDSVGPRRVNDPLSLARAQAVCDLFVRAGVDRRRLICVGYADTRLLPEYASTAAQQRRTALVLISVRAELAQEVKALIAEAMAH